MKSKPRVAIIRGPNLNQWEMQNFSPLSDEFELIGFTSVMNNYDISQLDFPVEKLFSLGQLLQSRTLRTLMTKAVGDYHDLLRLSRALNGFDIVHSVETSYYCTYQAALAKRTLGYKLVVTVWENIPFLHDSSRTRANKAVVFREADVFLAVSERAREALILEGVEESKIKVLTPGVNLENFRPLPKDLQLLQRYGCSHDDIIILFAGNLYREKGVFDLLHAFQRARKRSKRGTSLKLLIVGKGQERQNILEQIQRLSLEGHVRLIGSFSYDMMPNIHALANIFVLPSIPVATWQEQFGYVLVESMACGKPVVSTTSGSIPEVVGNAGILVPPNDFVSLSGALLELISNAKRRKALGANARKRAQLMFDTQHATSNIRQLYRTLL